MIEISIDQLRPGSPKQKGAVLLNSARRLSFFLLLSLDCGHILRCRAFLSLDHFKLNLLSFLQRLETFSLNGAVVDKNIVATGAFNEAKAFLVVEPLNGSTLTIGHICFLYFPLLEVGLDKNA
jgi:hypothetical protein